MDLAWWRRYLDEATATFRGEFVAPVQIHGVRREKFRRCRSSGEGALALAIHYGATRVVLLGYDAQHTGGLKHWHPDHPGMGNAGAAARWPDHFRLLARQIGAAVEVINASRVSALDAFPRMNLEDALGERDRHRSGQAPLARRA